MTILKIDTERKEDRSLELEKEEPQIYPPTAPSNNIESQRFYIALRYRRISAPSILCFVIISFVLTMSAIIGGTYLYRQYQHRQQLQHPRVYKGWCAIPFGKTTAAIMDPRNDGTQYTAYFELGLQNDDYENIFTLNIRNNTQATFIHDFIINKTAIVDESDNRCFIMELNRNVLLPPKSLYDLIKKLKNDSYSVDTEVITSVMRAMVPPLSDLSDNGKHISEACASFFIYELEDTEKQISERSATNVKFGMFAGKSVNIYEVVSHEKDFHL